MVEIVGVVSRGAYRLACRGHSSSLLFLTLDSPDPHKVRQDAEFCYSVLFYLGLCKIPISFKEAVKIGRVPGLKVTKCEEFFPRVCVWGVSREKGLEILSTPRVTMNGDVFPRNLAEEINYLSSNVFGALRNFLRIKTSPDESKFVLSSLSLKFGLGPKSEECPHGLLMISGAIGPEDVSILERTEDGFVKVPRDKLISLLSEKF